MGLPFTMRAEIKELIARRENMEAEIEALSSALQADGMPGVSGPLVDREGFPLANVDVHLVRDYRHRLICLHNDHKALTDRIEKALHETLSAEASSRATDEPRPAAAHAGAPSEPMETSARAAPGGAVNGSRAGLPADPPAQPPPPFATVGELTPGSLAASAGLEVGDLILQFGSVRGDNHR